MFKYRLGFNVASNPWKTIIFSLLITFTTFAGLWKFRIDKNPISMWLPQDSDFVVDTNWIVEQYGEGSREEIIIIEANDILYPGILQKLNYINDRIKQISVVISNGEIITYNDVCFKYLF